MRLVLGGTQGLLGNNRAAQLRLITARPNLRWGLTAVAEQSVTEIEGRPVRLINLKLSNFRNYRRLELELPPGPSVVIGANGQGKTNLVDAAHILATGRSLRPGPEAVWVRNETPAAEGFARLYATVDRSEGEIVIEMIVGRTTPDDGEASGVRRRVRIGGVRRRLSELPGHLLAVSFSPSDLDLWTGPPAIRRRWLDLAIAQLDSTYGEALEEYDRLLARRNALLRRIQGGLAAPTELRFWDEGMAGSAVTIMAARADYLARMRSPVGTAFKNMHGGAPLDIGYNASAGDMDAASFCAALRDRVDRDVQRGASGLGPHRDDIDARFGGRQLAHVGSRGQVRLAALALKLGQYEVAVATRGELAVLLLDDIAAELDSVHRKLLVDQLPAAAQSIVTTADFGLLQETALRDATHFRVTAGEIEPL